MPTEPFDDQFTSPTFEPGASTSRRKDMVGFYKVAVIVLSIVVVGLLAVMSQQSATTANPEATVTVTANGDPAGEQPPAEVEQAADPERDEFLMSFPRRLDGDPLAKGDVDAQMVMTEWADFRCPFCSVFTEDTLPLLQPLIDDGTLRIEFRDLAIFGEDSINAAAGARAAGEQGLYWEYATAMYTTLPNEGKPSVGDDVVTAVAQQVGVPDMEKFQADYAAPATREAIAADSAEAQGLGISGTPAFLIGTQFISGAQPIGVFQSVIADEIAKQG